MTFPDMERLAEIRLELAIDIATSAPIDAVLAQKLLDELIKIEPIVATMMELYGFS